MGTAAVPSALLLLLSPFAEKYPAMHYQGTLGWGWGLIQRDLREAIPTFCLSQPELCSVQ